MTTTSSSIDLAAAGTRLTRSVNEYLAALEAARDAAFQAFDEGMTARQVKDAMGTDAARHWRHEWEKSRGRA